jgi:hypothetical protein
MLWFTWKWWRFACNDGLCSYVRDHDGKWKRVCGWLFVLVDREDKLPSDSPEVPWLG